MRILQNIGIENRLAAGNKGIPTNGESVKVRYPAAVLLLSDVTKTQNRPASTRNFPGADLNPYRHNPDFPGEYMRLSSFGGAKGGSD